MNEDFHLERNRNSLTEIIWMIIDLPSIAGWIDYKMFNVFEST